MPNRKCAKPKQPTGRLAITHVEQCSALARLRMRIRCLADERPNTDEVGKGQPRQTAVSIALDHLAAKGGTLGNVRLRRDLLMGDRLWLLGRLRL